jgi:hypothetical protein
MQGGNNDALGLTRNHRLLSAATGRDGRGNSNGIFVCNWVGGTEARQGFIGCVLDAGSRPMEFAGCVGKNCGKKIAIWNVGHSGKNQIRTHWALRENQELVSVLDSLEAFTMPKMSGAINLAIYQHSRDLFVRTFQPALDFAGNASRTVDTGRKFSAHGLPSAGNFPGGVSI